LAQNSCTEPGGALVNLSLKRSASKDKFGRDNNTSNVMHIIDVREVAVSGSSPSASGGCCGNLAAPPTSTVLLALEIPLVAAGPPHRHRPTPGRVIQPSLVAPLLPLSPTVALWRQATLQHPPPGSPALWPVIVVVPSKDPVTSPDTRRPPPVPRKCGGDKLAWTLRSRRKLWTFTTNNGRPGTLAPGRSEAPLQRRQREGAANVLPLCRRSRGSPL
jgi:hypothetical protein